MRVSSLSRLPVRIISYFQQLDTSRTPLQCSFIFFSLPQPFQDSLHVCSRGKADTSPHRDTCFHIGSFRNQRFPDSPAVCFSIPVSAAYRSNVALWIIPRSIFRTNRHREYRSKPSESVKLLCGKWGQSVPPKKLHSDSSLLISIIDTGSFGKSSVDPDPQYKHYLACGRNRNGKAQPGNLRRWFRLPI